MEIWGREVISIEEFFSRAHLLMVGGAREVIHAIPQPHRVELFPMFSYPDRLPK